MCPYCRHPIDDHSTAGICLTCAKQSRECTAPKVNFVTIQIATYRELVPVSMPAVTSCGSAAMRAAEALGLDPQAKDWFLYDPVARVPLEEEAIMAAYNNRVLRLAWTEEKRGIGSGSECG